MSVLGVGAALVVLALLDGAFAGFRGSVGRDGRVRHRRDDVRFGLHGLGLAVLLQAPTAVVVLSDLGPARRDLWVDAGARMLSVYLPYAAVGLLAIGTYLLLGWRRKFLAIAVVLGPFTLGRPLVVVAGALAAAVPAADPWVWLVSAWCVVAALAVGPVIGLRWRAGRVVA